MTPKARRRSTRRCGAVGRGIATIAVGSHASLLLSLSVVLVVAGCAKPEPPAPTPVRPVKMLTVESGTEGGLREYPGTVSAVQDANLAFEVPGRMIEFPVTEGEEVEAGAILAKLDPRDYQARLDSAMANVRKAEADYRRSSNLYREDPGAIARTQIDADQRTVEVSKANAREAEKSVEDTVLRAPFSGVVARKLAADFANVQAKEPVVVLQDTSQLEVKVAVPERDIRGANRDVSNEELNKRLSPYVVVAGRTDRKFPARLTEVATSADPATRTFMVTLRFENPAEAAVLPGMTAMAVIRTRSEAGSTRIPVQAVAGGGGKDAFVWIFDAATSTVSKRNVRLDTMSEDQVVVLEGLAGGDVVVTSGLMLLRDGMKVRRLEERIPGSGS